MDADKEDRAGRSVDFAWAAACRSWIDLIMMEIAAMRPQVKKNRTVKRVIRDWMTSR